ncbi:MAG: glucose-6-phosphate isomerase, partial [Bacteroidales bacterium]|nr:glucose-6-phosphate isomerase [Bacteroidales bacterium]
MEKIINIEYASASSFLGKEKMKDAIAKASSALKILENRTGRGNDFLGWIDLPTKFSKDDFEKISNIVTEWRKKLEVVVIIGIGGSYLGAKAAIESLSNPFQQHLGKGEYPALLFAGQNMSEDYLSELISLLDKREYGVVVISKSGTTTEPAVAFRILKK